MVSNTLMGVPKTIIPDNLKTGVKQSNFYQPVITKAYQEMADYYQTIILPARVRKPKDKPSVENGVLISSRKILAKLRNKQILSFSNLQELISAAWEEINQSPLTGKNESRWSSYLAEEKDYLLIHMNLQNGVRQKFNQIATSPFNTSSIRCHLNT